MWENLVLEDVPENLRYVAMEIGVDNFSKLVQMFGGGLVYIPTIATIKRSYRNRMIREEFDGDYRATAIKYGLTNIQVRNIIKEAVK